MPHNSIYQKSLFKLYLSKLENEIKKCRYELVKLRKLKEAENIIMSLIEEDSQLILSWSNNIIQMVNHL
tara:strand:+ start:165 stop:371 length:207 start_codon:yes stop_codon:yes gene_type:complete